ncbi:hypothetical protein NQ314_017208 [Rhamnusium bicolor]|uniref:KN motif and ankyrin repeat domain-containing protein 1 n=1 Tax=Rhamnusium bicolor TaxID=1586634 RepID=A0AAV8WU47_9CUCU|nr:hypothetical protein NQ314_017208 [Rhamnusium bicolor]
MSSASGSSLTVLPTAPDGPVRHDFDAVSIESCGLSPIALQNIREQMALSLERTKQLEDQVKLLPELKEQLSNLREENKHLILRLKSEEMARLNTLNANYLQSQYNRQRSLSFTHVDSLDNLIKKEPPPPPPRKDFGVMCGVLTRNIGVGHQNPNTKSVSTATFEYEFADKWLQEKVKFLNNQNLMNSYSSKKLLLDKVTQTLATRDKRDVGIQLKIEKAQIPKVNGYSQTAEIKKSVNHVSVLAIPKISDFSVQKYVECYSIGCSDDTIDDIICEKCNAFKRSVAVGPETSEDTHTSSISLASLTSRSKSFNLGDDRLNFSARTRTTASQYEPNNISRGCQSDLKTKTSTKSCQHELKVLEKNTQYESRSVSKVTDTLDLVLPKRHVSCEAKEAKPDTNDFGCNTVTEMTVCVKCDSEKDDLKGSVKKEGGSPTPSRIPRPQLPTTPVENRKFRRQDTYTKIYSSPTEKTAPTSPVSRLSGLDLSPKALSSELDPLDKVKQNFKLTEVSTSSHAQNGVNLASVTKVQIQEITLPTSESTNFSAVVQSHTVPSKEMQGALKVLNDSLQKSPSKNLKNHSAINIVQQEWFKISSLVTANPLDVEDYLDAFEDMSNLLLQYIVNMSDSSGNTAMHYAVSHGNFDVVSILLDSKVCDINKPNKAGYTSVMLVSLAEVRSQTHANVVRRLFQLADVNIRAKQHGQTALMLAVSHGRLDMVKMLLEAGADINIQDEDGSTALMCAAEHGHIEIDGSTALKIAMEAGHRHIGVLLYAHKRNHQKTTSNKLKKTKSISPKTPSSPLPIRSSHRALTDTTK